uniref:Uncharacterized protein n=1 Tax=Oryza punctata TaxID=4537 RepID=A0A0E0LJN3_ORYPU
MRPEASGTPGERTPAVCGSSLPRASASTWRIVLAAPSAAGSSSDLVLDERRPCSRRQLPSPLHGVWYQDEGQDSSVAWGGFLDIGRPG